MPTASRTRRRQAAGRLRERAGVDAAARLGACRRLDRRRAGVVRGSPNAAPRAERAVAADAGAVAARARRRGARGRRRSSPTPTTARARAAARARRSRSPRRPRSRPRRDSEGARGDLQTWVAMHPARLARLDRAGPDLGRLGAAAARAARRCRVARRARRSDRRASIGCTPGSDSRAAAARSTSSMPR